MRFSRIPEAERNITIQKGCPVVLHCELSDPSAQVHWYKDGSKFHPQTGADILSDGSVRTLVVHSAEFSHSGLYCCKTKGDSITFSVEITGDLSSINKLMPSRATNLSSFFLMLVITQL